MYIDKNGFNTVFPSAGTVNVAQVAEDSETTAADMADNSPGYAPISPETPSWGPPSGSNDSNDPGYAPISPETPSWGPPSGSNDSNDPGYAPISPETPSWGPPSASSPGFAPISPSTPSWGPPSGSTGSTGGIVGSIVVVPGQTICPNCPSGGQPSGTQYANVRFLHAAVNQSAVNIRLGNQTVINNMQFGNVTPYYLENANQNLQVIITNVSTGQTLYRGSFSFASQTAYTIAIINDNSGISLFTVTDMACTSRNSGCLRAVNLSPNSGPVDIFLSGYGRVFQRVNQFAATEYQSIRQGTYRVSVSEALPCIGNSSIIIANEYVECSNTRIAIMDTATLNMMNGVTYTLYIIGLAYQFPAVQILPVESDLVY